MNGTKLQLKCMNHTKRKENYLLITPTGVATQNIGGNTMDCILKKVCESNRAAQIQVAYAIGICETFLRIV